ncbi:HNH endonuclease [Streptomyces sp. NPDC002990]
MTEAAARCGTIEEVVARYGIDPHAGLGHYLMRRFSAYGIDVAHFRRRPYTRHEKPDVASLREAVPSSRSLAETLRRLGRPPGPRWRESLQGWIRASGLDTSHFLGQAHQRGKPGPLAPTAAEILVRHEGKRRTGTKALLRALREVGVPDRCDRCGIPPEWRGLPMTLRSTT